MKVAVTGSSGLVGTGVVARLEAEGHRVTRVVRSRDTAGGDAIFWNPATGSIDADGLAGHDAVINLAGENIYGIWTEPRTRRIRESRVRGTRLLAETLAGLPPEDRPDVLVNASAAGYYGDRPADERLNEEAGPGDSLLAGIVTEWEAATDPARGAGVRVVMTRSGVVLHPDAIVVQAMALSTRLGLGAKLGSGDQVFPWVTRDDVVNAFMFILGNESLAGPVNVVGREKVTNEEFADTFARVLGRPRLLTIPASVVRILGEIGDEVLRGMWMVPEKLQAAGYDWVDPDLEPALRRMLR
jgi:uncharacterized protein (TIGR01777 family)